MPVRRKPQSLTPFSFDEATLHAVAMEYGFRAIDRVLPLLADGDSCSLLEARSETTRKVVFVANDDKWFLKEVPWYCDDLVHLRFSIGLQEHLRSAGLPIPIIRPTRAAQNWLELDGRRFVLTLWQQGRRYEQDAADSGHAVECLARLHCNSHNFSGGYREDLFDLAAAHIRLLRQLQPDGSVQELTRELERILEHERSAALGNGWLGLDSYAVHGDFNPWNLVFDTDSGSVCAIADFDNCDTGTRLHDIAEALLTFNCLSYRGDTTRFSHAPHAGIGTQHLDTFFKKYDAIAPLSATERRCLGHAVVAVAIELFCLALIRGDFSPVHAHTFQQFIEAVKRWRIPTESTQSSSGYRPRNRSRHTHGSPLSSPSFRRAFLIASGKGGTGKSTLTAVLAGLAAQSGHAVGVIDADLAAPNAHLLLGATARPVVCGGRPTPAVASGVRLMSTGLLHNPEHPFIWHAPVTSGLLAQFVHDTDWGALDYLFVDLPPGSTDALLAVADLLPIAGVVLVSTTHPLARADSLRLLRGFQGSGRNVSAVVLNTPIPSDITVLHDGLDGVPAMSLPYSPLAATICTNGLSRLLATTHDPFVVAARNLLEQLT